MSTTRNISILISGKVQGVFFRASAKAKADELGITGTVQNKANGQIYVEAEGESDKLILFEEWCKQGPPLAYVDAVEVLACAPKHFYNFTILR
jgi:acylphosphatase